MTRNFDLNIEKILEGLEVRHAVLEFIANALDEEALTGTASATISRTDERAWTIRDYGRGLRYEDLTQDENEEKLGQPGKVIGKFGVGLKNALAALNRRDVEARILKAQDWFRGHFISCWAALENALGLPVVGLWDGIGQRPKC